MACRCPDARGGLLTPCVDWQRHAYLRDLNMGVAPSPSLASGLQIRRHRLTRRHRILASVDHSPFTVVCLPYAISLAGPLQGELMRGVERRIATGRNPRVASVVSVFVSRLDVAGKNKVSNALGYPCA